MATRRRRAKQPSRQDSGTRPPQHDPGQAKRQPRHRQHGPGQAKRQPSSPEDSYRSVQFASWPVGPTTDVLVPRRGQLRLVAPELAQALRGCDTFRSLPAHAKEQARLLEIRGDISQLLEAELAKLRQAGLLVSKTELLQRATEQPGPEPQPAPLQQVGICTRARFDSLCRCVQSWHENLQAAGRLARLVVLDDTPSASERTKLRAWTLQHEARPSYAGRDEKEQYAESLVREGLDPGLVHFALLGDPAFEHTLGANRNGMLLDADQQAHVLCDDDVRCTLCAPPELGAELRVQSTLDPTSYWFYANRRTALAAARTEQVDILGALEAYLGKRVGRCLREHSGPLDLERMSQSLLDTLLSGEAEVCVCCTGLVGDSGLASPQGLLLLAGRSRERLLHSEASYRAALGSREVLRAATAPTIAETPYFIAQLAAYAGQRYWPPFFPVGRSSEGLQAVALALSAPASHAAFLPWAAWHHPPEPRRHWPADISARRFNLNDLLRLCLLSCEPPVPGLGAQRALLRLGRHLCDLGSLALEDFAALLRERRALSAHGYVQLLEEALYRHEGEPEYWAADVEELIVSVQSSLESDRVVLPEEFEHFGSPAAALCRAQQLVARYGELIQAWPDVLEAAARLRERGITLAGDAHGG